MLQNTRKITKYVVLIKYVIKGLVFKLESPKMWSCFSQMTLQYMAKNIVRITFNELCFLVGGQDMKIESMGDSLLYK